MLMTSFICFKVKIYFLKKYHRWVAQRNLKVQNFEKSFETKGFWVDIYLLLDVVHKIPKLMTPYYSLKWQRVNLWQLEEPTVLPLRFLLIFQFFSSSYRKTFLRVRPMFKDTRFWRKGILEPAAYVIVFTIPWIFCTKENKTAISNHILLNDWAKKLS